MIIKQLRRRLSLTVREKVLRHYLIPYSKTGLEPGIVNFLKPNKPINFVDIGASSGSFAQSVMEYCGIRNALLIEPQPDQTAKLIARFPSNTISIRTCAISDREQQTEMDVLNWHYSSSLLPLKGEVAGLDKIVDLKVRERIQVQVHQLDHVMAAMPWRDETIDLMKVDVQGSELAVFQGAQETLRKTRMIWTEVSFRPIYERSASFADIYSYLDQNGFMLLWISPGTRGAESELLEGDVLFAKRN
jgi:FkbM family methyltransferase